MKIWSSEHVFNHPWENVVKAAVQKYPNPLNPSVTGVDVIERHYDPTNRIIKSHRLLATQWSMPNWISRLLGNSTSTVCHASEHSEIDAYNKTMSLRSRNLTFNTVLNVDERLVYTEHPEDRNKTLLTQEAQITVQNVPVVDYLEEMLATKMSANAHKGRQAIEYVIKKMEHITNHIEVDVANLNNNLKQFNSGRQQQQQ